MQDMTGNVFGRLTVIEVSERRGAGHSAKWLCQCSCGRMAVCDGSYLRSGTTKSCGCLRREMGLTKNHTHGLSRTKEYRTWGAIIQRCYNTSLPSYPNYGGRGVTVCDVWRTSFERFLRDMGPAPSPEHSIERIDNSKGYSPENCKWATKMEQMRNKRGNRLLTHDGRTMTAAEWGCEIGISGKTIRARIDQHGWSVSKALTTPLPQTK